MASVGRHYAAIAQSVERFLGKEEVTGSIPVSSWIRSSKNYEKTLFLGLLFIKIGANFDSASGTLNDWKVVTTFL